MKAIIFIALIWAIVRLVSAIHHKAQEEKAERERQRIREEQSAIREQMRMDREQMRLDRERAKEETRARIESERARLAWQKRQDTINRQAAQERARLAKEQERQAKELAKHEEMILQMTEQLRKADADIDFLTSRVADLDAQLDYQLLLQTSSLPGSKGFEKCQSKIVTLRNQIHCAESRLANAEYKREQAQRKLA